MNITRLAVALTISLTCGAGVPKAHADPPAKLAFAYSTIKGFAKVAVWNDAESSERGMAMLAAGDMDNDDLIKVNEMAACIIPNGTPIFVSTTGFIHQNVVVMKGKNEGCTGSIWSSEVRAK